MSKNFNISSSETVLCNNLVTMECFMISFPAELILFPLLHTLCNYLLVRQDLCK